MAVYKNIVNTEVNNLITKVDRSGKQNDGNISSIHISNNLPVAAVVDLYLEDHTDSNIKYYLLNSLNIPGNVSLTLDNNVAFRVSKFKLDIRANEGSTTPGLSVIIK